MATNEDPTDVLEVIRRKVAKQIELARQKHAAENAELERVKLAPVQNVISDIIDEFEGHRDNAVGKYDKNRLSVQERIESYGQARNDIKEKIAELNRQLGEIEKSEEEGKVELEELSKGLKQQLQDIEKSKTAKLERPFADLELAKSELLEKERRFILDIAAKKKAEEQTILSIRSIWEEESIITGPVPQTAPELPQQPQVRQPDVLQTIENPPSQTVNPPSLLPFKSPEPSSTEKSPTQEGLEKEEDELANRGSGAFAFNNTPPTSPAPSTSCPQNSRGVSEVSEALSEIFVSSVNANCVSTSLPNNKCKEATNDFGTVFTVSSDGYYTSPDYMKGVPIAKLTEESEYWVPTWTNARTCIEEEKQSPKEVENTLKWFEEKCSIHPNQLISKQYYDKKGLLNRNYINSLRKIFQNLAAANISDPVRWLRVRLGRIIQERLGQPGIGFRLKQTLYDYKRNNSEYMEICKVVSLNKARSAKSKVLKQAKPKNGRQDTSPDSKRDQHIAGLPSFQRPSKLQRVEVKSPTSFYVSPGYSANSISKPRNNAPYQQEPSSSSLDHGLPRKKTATSKPQVNDPPRQQGPAFSPNYEASFDLSFFRCGTKKWEKPNCPIRMKLNADTKLFDPFSGDTNLIALQPDMAIKPQDITDLEFHTRYEQGDAVMLQRIRKPGEACWAGDGTRVIMAFKHPDDADKFVVLLCNLNGNIKMSQSDRKRHLIHAREERSLPQARHHNENETVHVQIPGRTVPTKVFT